MLSGITSLEAVPLKHVTPFQTQALLGDHLLQKALGVDHIQMFKEPGEELIQVALFSLSLV